MKILAIDTAANLCAACLYDTNTQKVFGKEVHDIGRGHAEKLLPTIDETLEAAASSFADIERIVVCVGPGSFTGIRVGVAAARGLGLALEKQVVGVTTFEALAHVYHQTNQPDEPFAIAFNGGRGQIFAQGFDALGAPDGEPFILKSEDEARAIDKKYKTLIGNAAAKLDESRAVENYDNATGAIESIALLGRGSSHEAKPLYLRAADAKVATGFALPRKAEAAS